MAGGGFSTFVWGVVNGVGAGGPGLGVVAAQLAGVEGCRVAAVLAGAVGSLDDDAVPDAESRLLLVRIEIGAASIADDASAGILLANHAGKGEVGHRSQSRSGGAAAIDSLP